MKLPSLSFGYSITKPFPRRYRYGLLAFAGLSAAAFMTINVFLVGYEVISITTPDFNSTHAAGLQIWQSEGSSSGCNPHQFQLGDAFRTNISAFSYSIFDVESSESAAGVSPIAGGFLYSNEVISVCDVDQYEIAVKPGDRLITVTATVQCPSPLGFRAVTSWSYSNHGILGSLSAGTFPTDSMARAIMDGMTNISTEAYQDIYNKLYTTNGTTGISQEIYTVLAEGQPSCDTSPPFSCVVPPFSLYNAIGNTDLNILPGPADVAADEVNLYNVINVFYAAVRLDLGHWTADNVFTNTTSFAQLVPVTNSSNSAFRSIATSKGMAYTNSSSPMPANVPTPPAVIQIPYTCNVMQRKPTGSFIVSVLSATLSMFLGAWGLIIAILSAIVRRNTGANTCEHHGLPTYDDREDPINTLLLMPSSKWNS
ncbi:hypothetical protein K438DRAFT_532743 [Mycena galopus ATCC 62051]|nr:hypothetical protein K438DRAFT_532743 [Mycena galopus ATCC 62051]